jgi:replicative DNA helicase
LNLDISVLRLMKTRAAFERYRGLIPGGVLSPETTAFIRHFGGFFTEVDTDSITYDAFWPYLSSKYPNWTDDQRTTWQALLLPVDGDNPPGYDHIVVRNLLTTELSGKVLRAVEGWESGEEVELSAALRTMVEKFDSESERRIKSDLVTLPWDQMLAEAEDESGLTLGIPCLDQCMKPLTPGAFGIIAMRPDRGKTSLCGVVAASFARQMHAAGETRPVMWLNNEGPGSRILGRIRQAVLQKTLSELHRDGSAAAEREYVARGGNLIQVRDIHLWRSFEVEDLISRVNPAVVFWDMIDNIQFSGTTVNGGERTDQFLESMYQWARSLCVKYEMIGIATSQLSGDAEGLHYPEQKQLKDSKSGKQGACDFIITGGYDDETPSLRYIGCTKNKLKREGAPASPRAVVKFDSDRCMFNEPKME